MAEVSVQELVKGLGGKENIVAAEHCQTRLRVTPKDKSKVDQDALKKVPGVLGVVDTGRQVQVVIGAEVANVYEKFVEETGVPEEAPIDENLDQQTMLKEDLKNRKGAGLTRFFETISAIFSPIVPALAGCGFLSAIIMVFMAFGASMSSPTFANFVTIAMAIFTFLPFLLAASTAKVFKMNQYVALTIAAAMMAPSWANMIAAGTTTSSFAGIPFRVIDYSSSVLPIVCAIILASYIEKFFNKHVKGPLKIIIVPAATILFSTLITLWTVGPFTYWLGELIAQGMDWMFSHGTWIAGLIYGAIYSGMVVLGVHHGMVPVLTQMLADNGYNFVSPTSGSANLGQAGAAFGVWLRTKNKPELRANAASACIAACVGITEPVLYGVNVPQHTFLYGSIGGAVGGAVAGFLGLKAYAIGGPSFLSFGMFMGGNNPFLNCGLVMMCFGIAFVVGALLTYFLWKPQEN